jgi:hypothetical protein
MNTTQRDYFDRFQQIDYKDEPVVVNDFSLRIGNRLYPIDYISRYKIDAATPNPFTGILLTIVGLLLVSLGFIKIDYLNQFISTTSFQQFTSSQFALPSLDLVFSGASIIDVIGISILVLGLIRLATLRKFYVLRVVMGAEELDVMASRKKDKIHNIAAAIDRQLNKPKKEQKVMKKRVVVYS